MYYEQPYTVPQRPPLRTVRRMNIRQNTSLRYLLICLGGVCCLLIIAALITIFVIYFVRNRDNISSLLSYPDFVCNQRPCGCPNYNLAESSIAKTVDGKYTYPWLVALTDRYTANPICAGFIISSNAILTAAHCLNGRNLNQIHILTRVHDPRQSNSDHHDIEQWFIHPEYRYNDSMHLNDIALIKIKKSFAGDLSPSCLPSTHSSIYPQAKTIAVISGWGNQVAKPNNQNSENLQHVVMPVIDQRNVKCRQSVGDINRQLCAGYESFSSNTCSGDSGAPLLVVERDGKKQGHFVAAGIVSYGNRPCDRSITSGVYTRVSFYLPWIHSILASS